MKNKIKKLFILIMLGAAAAWLIHTVLVFYGYVSLWGELRITTRALASQLIIFIGKNVPTLIAVLIGKSKWD